MVNADVRENINSIDAIMKAKADYYKNYNRRDSATDGNMMIQENPKVSSPI